MPDSVPTDDDDVVRRWLAAGEKGDADAAIECTSHDVVLASPVTDRFFFRGHAQIHALLTSVFSAVSDIRYHTELGEGDTRALFYKGRIGTHDFEMTQLLRLDGNGLIRELKMFGRPLPALAGFFSAVGPEIAGRRGHPVLTSVVRASTSALEKMSVLGDRHLVPLVDPSRGPTPRLRRSSRRPL